jgi:hypothetical protein
MDFQAVPTWYTAWTPSLFTVSKATKILNKTDFGTGVFRYTKSWMTAIVRFPYMIKINNELTEILKFNTANLKANHQTRY